jgi:hypothetical protein
MGLSSNPQSPSAPFCPNLIPQEYRSRHLMSFLFVLLDAAQPPPPLSLRPPRRRRPSTQTLHFILLDAAAQAPASSCSLPPPRRPLLYASPPARHLPLASSPRLPPPRRHLLLVARRISSYSHRTCPPQAAAIPPPH